MYLLQYIGIDYVWPVVSLRAGLEGEWAKFIVIVLSVLPIAFVNYALVERPCTRLGHTLARRLVGDDGAKVKGATPELL
eukprot:CAMPEP_0181231046 /NCGR_PEP_ID=MMETSP1096-20121128/34859_1 /TAXON_ID=156174 ORGANISM="Chrysochromulina ericina, Strain CCMP281" /NCGR_SAMPLE_ID=MMETSP1096 /ASSEMBLY_ACC=CAM_ASM_000453 /LENGTH=78 /DNA_ID=CAMNT_0023324985 /DNA_START=27 /DNA_END=263 /DNA_ORIENTATION=+